MLKNPQVKLADTKFNYLGHVYELNVIKNSAIEITEEPSINQLKLNYDFKVVETITKLTADTSVNMLILHLKIHLYFILFYFFVRFYWNYN